MDPFVRAGIENERRAIEAALRPAELVAHDTILALGHSPDWTLTAFLGSEFERNGVDAEHAERFVLDVGLARYAGQRAFFGSRLAAASRGEEISAAVRAPFPSLRYAPEQPQSQPLDPLDPFGQLGRRGHVGYTVR